LRNFPVFSVLHSQRVVEKLAGVRPDDVYIRGHRPDTLVVKIAFFAMGSRNNTRLIEEKLVYLPNSEV
jgi:hypothetical protein